MLKHLQDNAGIVSTPPLDPTTAAGSSAAASAEPSVTLSYDEWNKNEFPWADFSEVTSAPSSSRNIGKAPMVDDEDEEYEYDEDDVSGDEDGDGEDSGDGGDEDYSHSSE